MEMGRMAAIPGSWRRSCPQSLASLPAVPASSFTSWAPRPFPNSCPGTLKPFLCHSGIFRSLPDPSTALSSGKPPCPDELPLCKYISLCKKQAPNSDLCRVYFWTWIFLNFFFFSPCQGLCSSTWGSTGKCLSKELRRMSNPGHCCQGSGGGIPVNSQALWTQGFYFMSSSNH